MVVTRSLFSITIFLLLSLSIYSQSGRLLLVGGGSEKNGISSWSTPAYKWAGEGKKVAIVGMSTGSLAQYFQQQCGALRAKEFAISTHDSADSQATYDTLTSYDVIFFRGGDQWDYYSLYKNTRLLDAVNEVYTQGGTIGGTSAGMHILSSIVFTAENGTVYPYECIENPNNQYVTLANDFLDLVPGFVFDTHFAERGRFGRLAGFLANYQLNYSQNITGLGMDDLTCMTVDENWLGTVYGTGCANLYLAGASYSLNGTKLLADTINIRQLLHGCTYNFATGESGYAGLDKPINTSQIEETGNYTVLASGNSSLSNSQLMLGELVNNSGEPSAEILLLTGDASLAASYSDKLIQLGAPQVHIFEANMQSGNDPDLANLINLTTKMLFLKNDYTQFEDFLETTNGLLLLQKIKSNGMITAFAGEDARLAGKTVVENYLTPGASYYAELTFHKGLSLLAHSVIMPDTYLNNDIYENTATAVPYAMLLDTLKYGIWLTNHSFMKFCPVDGKTLLTAYGAAPVMVVTNRGNLAGFSSHTSTGNTTTEPRMVAGFEHLQLALIDDTTPFIMGNVQVSAIGKTTYEMPVIISPNPVKNSFTVIWNANDFSWEIFDITGKCVSAGTSSTRNLTIDTGKFCPGLYFLKLKTVAGFTTSHFKFVKE